MYFNAHFAWSELKNKKLSWEKRLINGRKNEIKHLQYWYLNTTKLEMRKIGTFCAISLARQNAYEMLFFNHWKSLEMKKDKFVYPSVFFSQEFHKWKGFQ